MKRFTTLLLIFSLLTCSSSAYAASKPTVNWKNAYKPIVSKHLKSELFAGGDNYITLVDIDQDGIPELFGGEAYRTVNYVEFAYTFKNGKAKLLKQTGPGGGFDESESRLGFKLGMQGFTKGNIKVFTNKKTGKYTVIVTDGTNSVAGGTIEEYTLSLKGTNLTSQEISTAYYNFDGFLEDEFTFKGKKVSKSNYDKQRINYFSQLKQKSSNIKQLNGWMVTRKMEDSGWSKDKIVNEFLK